MVGAPDGRARARRHRRVHRAAGRRREAPLRAAHEAAALVGLVELQRVDARADVAAPRLERLAEDAGRDRERVHHQAPPDEAARVREPVRELRAGRQEQESRAADGVRGQHDDVRLGALGPALRVHVLRPREEPVPAEQEPRRTRAREHARPVCDRLRPVGDVGRRLGALRASLHAGAPLRARVAPRVRRREDRARRGPPVPAEPVVRAHDIHHAAAERQRGQREVGALGIGRVAREAGDADLAGDAVVGRLELLVREGPVVGDAVERPDAEVGRRQARPVAGVEHRRAADAVVHQRRDVRLRDVDRVVGRSRADVRVGRPLLGRLELPVGLRPGVVGAIGPVALLQADHVHPGLREPASRRRRRRRPLR